MSKYDLVGVDGNAFAIIAYVNKALQREGLSELKKDFQTNATSGDYDNVISVSMVFVEKANAVAEIEDEGEKQLAIVGIINYDHDWWTEDELELVAKKEIQLQN